jgi:Na+-driven multidrug efflux pump
MFPIFGINGGAQPLIGYNFGARRFARVRSAARWAILAASAVSLAAFAVVQSLPRGITGLFSGDDAALLDLSSFGLRIVYLLLPMIGFQICASGYFTSVGKPLKAVFLTLSRQLLFLVPLAFLLPRFLGLNGLFLAVPISDGLAILVTAGFFLSEMRGLGRGEKAPEPDRGVLSGGGGR